MAIRAIFFDFDGVLVDSELLHWETWSEVLKPKGIVVTWRDYSRRFIGVSNRAMIQMLCRDAGQVFDLHLFDAWYAEKRTLYQARHLRIPDDLVRFILEGLIGYRLGVVSSSQRSEVEPYLERSGVRARLDVIVCAEDASEWKPSPEPYRRAAELAGIAPGACLVVEDSEAGAESARQAGMTVVRVTGPGEVVAQVRGVLHVR